MFLRVLLLTAILATSAFPIFALVIAPAALVAVLWAVPLALRAQGNAGTALPVRNTFEVLPALGFAAVVAVMVLASRSEEHTSELQSLMRISYGLFCLKKKTYIEKNASIHIRTNRF